MEGREGKEEKKKTHNTYSALNPISTAAALCNADDLKSMVDELIFMSQAWRGVHLNTSTPNKR